MFLLTKCDHESTKDGLLVEAENMPAFIIEPKLIIVSHVDDLGCTTSKDR